MKKKRRKFSSEFMERAAKLVLEQGMTRTKVAEDLGVNLNQISKWVREYLAKDEVHFDDNLEAILVCQAFLNAFFHEKMPQEEQFFIVIEAHNIHQNNFVHCSDCMDCVRV